MNLVSKYKLRAMLYKYFSRMNFSINNTSLDELHRKFNVFLRLTILRIQLKWLKVRFKYDECRTWQKSMWLMLYNTAENTETFANLVLDNLLLNGGSLSCAVILSSIFLSITNSIQCALVLMRNASYIPYYFTYLEIYISQFWFNISEVEINATIFEINEV